MSVSTVFSRAYVSFVTGRGLRAPVLAGALAFSCVVGGCSAVLPSSVIPLPSVSSSEQLRIDLVSSESAVAFRAKELASKSSSCASCAEVAADVAANAQARIEALGGVWEPWDSDLPASAEVERQWPVSEPPLLPRNFVAWVIATAREDIVRILEADLSTQDRPAALASAAARLLAAHRLADAFGVEIDLALVAQLRSEIAAPSPDELVGWSSWDVSDTRHNDVQSEVLENAPQSAFVASGGSDVLEQALVFWDCAAQSLPGVGISTDRVVFANQVANALLARVSVASRAFDSDVRPLRCVSSADSLEQVGANVLGADFLALEHEDSDVVLWAEDVMASDIELWAPYLDESFLFDRVIVDADKAAQP